MTINGVNFTNIPNKKLGLLMSLGLTQTNIHEQETIEEYLQSERFYKLIHAIDIDWDGIEVAPNVIINDTSDLINWILEHSSSGGSGSQGPQGDPGKSAYEIAVEEGFVGSKAEWLQSLIGPTGAKGADGARGLKGDTGNDGKSAYDLYKESVNEHGDIYSFTSWSLDGNTAYGEGTVEVIEQRLGGAKVKVLTNTDFGSNPTDFVGMEFDVQQPLNEGDLIQLYIGDEPQPIAVRATLQSPAVVAMTRAEWLVSLKGADGQPGAAGQDGAPGQDGITPHIDQTTGNWFIGETNTGISAQGPAGLNGSNGNDGVTPHIDLTSGNWFIGDTDTGVSALGPSGQNGTNGTNGQDGKSAYQSYLDTTSDDHALSESDWIASLHGQNGADGQDGLDGQDGTNGKSAYELAVDNGYEGTIQQWLDSLKGQDGTNGNDGTDGKSAYLSYVDTTSDNPILTEAEWIASLHGSDGQNGLDGSNGLDGQNGLDGITPSIDPTTKHWMIGSTDTGVIAEGLNGTNGTNGTDGKSAYQSYVDTTSDDPVLTEELWIASLHGQDGSNGTNGTNGKSAYQSYVDTTSDDPILTEQQWVASLHGTNGLDGTNGQDGVTPTIDPTTKHWMFGSTDTGVVAEGQNGTNGTNGTNGVTPHIDSSTKHWMIGETDTGIIAEGLDGQNGTNGTNGVTPHIDPTTGNWFIGETNTGVHAQGETGTFDPSDLEDYATIASVNEALENKLDNIKSIELYNNDETLTIYNAGMDNTNPFYISNESIKDLPYKVNGSSVELFIDGESKGTVLFEHTVGDEYDDNAIIFGHGILKDSFIPLAEDGWIYADYSEDDNTILINPNITVDGNTLTAGSVHNIKLVLNVSYDVIIMDTQSKIGNIGNKVEAAEEVYYTEEEANAYNATLEGALEAGEPLTQEQAGAYNAAITGATKEENDELSEAEANLYNATLTDAVSTYDVKTPAVTAVPYTNVGEVLSDIKTQLGGISIVKITQTAYGNLQTKDPNTLYIVIED